MNDETREETQPDPNLSTELGENSPKSANALPFNEFVSSSGHVAFFYAFD